MNRTFYPSFTQLKLGIILGGAFGLVVKSLVDNIVMPIIGGICNLPDFSQMFHAMDGKEYETLELAQKGGPTVAYGLFINNTINLLIVGLALFKRFSSEKSVIFLRSRISKYLKNLKSDSPSRWVAFLFILSGNDVRWKLPAVTLKVQNYQCNKGNQNQGNRNEHSFNDSDTVDREKTSF